MHTNFQPPNLNPSTHQPAGYCVTLCPHLLQVRLCEKFVMKFSAKESVFKKAGLSREFWIQTRLGLKVGLGTY